MHIYNSLLLQCYDYSSTSTLLRLFFLKIPRPPRSTRTSTRLPYTTLFRAWRGRRAGAVDDGDDARRHPGSGADLRRLVLQPHRLAEQLPGDGGAWPAARSLRVAAAGGKQSATRSGRHPHPSDAAQFRDTDRKSTRLNSSH